MRNLGVLAENTFADGLYFLLPICPHPHERMIRQKTRRQTEIKASVQRVTGNKPKLY
jgi:hypothetical protein